MTCLYILSAFSFYVKTTLVLWASLGLFWHLDLDLERVLFLREDLREGFLRSTTLVWASLGTGVLDGPIFPRTLTASHHTTLFYCDKELETWEKLEQDFLNIVNNVEETPDVWKLNTLWFY